jgi:hypothetical protein
MQELRLFVLTHLSSCESRICWGALQKNPSHLSPGHNFGLLGENLTLAHLELAAACSPLVPLDLSAVPWVRVPFVSGGRGAVYIPDIGPGARRLVTGFIERQELELYNSLALLLPSVARETLCEPEIYSPVELGLRQLGWSDGRSLGVLALACASLSLLLYSEKMTISAVSKQSGTARPGGPREWPVPPQ